MGTGQVLARVRAEHDALRRVLATLEALSRRTSAQDPEALLPLRKHGLDLHARLCRHLDFEERELLPVIEREGDWGWALARQIRWEHDEQRLLLRFVFERLSDETRPAVLLARDLACFAAELREDMAPAPEFRAASERFGGQARLGADGSLVSYVAAEPFPMGEIDCARDPNAGAKLAWNFDQRWEGDGAAAHFFYRYWDRGEELPLFYEGTSKRIRLANRVEADLLERNAGGLFRGERRKLAFGLEVSAPFDARGLTILTYRYKDSQRPTSGGSRRVARTRGPGTFLATPFERARWRASREVR
jgi:hypothetical protein